MSKSTNRPMSEYESALNSILGVLASSLVRLGIVNRDDLIHQIHELIQNARDDGRTNGAATLDQFIRCYLRESATYYTPGPISPGERGDQ